MGVHHLWKILDPVKKPVKIESLKGQTLAVDLSVWVCDAQGVKQMQGHVAKPHIRNLFFRVAYLLQLGVNLIFVVDGEAPEVKWEAMVMRQQARSGPGHMGGQSAEVMTIKPSRAKFEHLVNEACEMLDYLGVPYVQSVGEAEAFCALLNKEGVADCVVTQDGDAFLYGATKVYKNFTINTKDSSIESYSLVDVETQLNLNRDKLVALGILLGCDYVPKGVPGVGKETAMKFMKQLSGTESVLEKFREWRKMSTTTSHKKESAIAVKIRVKALELPDFPFENVIKEFMVVKNHCPKKRPEWKKPQIDKLYGWFNERLGWRTPYINEKVIPLMTLHDLRMKAKNCGHQPEPRPERIVKARVRQFVPCFEVLWKKLDYDKHPGNTQAFYTTFEERDLFTQCYPELVSAFDLDNKKPSKGERKQRKKKGESETKEMHSDHLSESPDPNLQLEPGKDIAGKIVRIDQDGSDGHDVLRDVKEQLGTPEMKKLNENTPRKPEESTPQKPNEVESPYEIESRKRKRGQPREDEMAKKGKRMKQLSLFDAIKSPKTGTPTKLLHTCRTTQNVSHTPPRIAQKPTPPAKNLMPLFTKASAEHFGTPSTSGSLVNEPLVKKDNIPSKCSDALVSPKKVTHLSESTTTSQ